jgi:hypothetical protein
MSGATDQKEFEAGVLRKYGAKWAVLAAMASRMTQEGIQMPPAVYESLRAARSKMLSGCFSVCDVGCDLAQVEGQLFSYCDRLELDAFQEWCDLLAAAMQGKLDYQAICGIAALDPIRADCAFLGCGCST